MKIKLLIDEDVHIILANTLRKRGYDVVNVQELNKKGLSDDELIIEAIKSERTILTFNVKDFVILHKKMVAKNDHYGIIVSKQISLNETLKKLLKLLQTTSSEEMQNKIEFL